MDYALAVVIPYSFSNWEGLQQRLNSHILVFTLLHMVSFDDSLLLFYCLSHIINRFLRKVALYAGRNVISSSRIAISGIPAVAGPHIHITTLKDR